jgi:hypothetical protein
MNAHDNRAMQGHILSTFYHDFRVVVVQDPVRDLAKESVDELELHGG